MVVLVAMVLLTVDNNKIMMVVLVMRRRKMRLKLTMCEKIHDSRAYHYDGPHLCHQRHIAHAVHGSRWSKPKLSRWLLVILEFVPYHIYVFEGRESTDFVESSRHGEVTKHGAG